ncbi:type II toxin-antitoxin system RelE/ParE family toxin [Arabiibacter massiliensis]|uniref:type II toxin-antitoxin system RelE/ParE family toxin n=1 Tax=Arabiibacter massiliensis TaxID=1870985 RepID=UPI0009BB6C24|nr:type II toxin-antitoxin system RelE/ParE family toxin [Arabiibacter massiliensis]
MGEWEVNLNLIQPWLEGLDSDAAAHVKRTLAVLRREGPSLGRPLVDSVSGSAFGNMKELRPPSPGRSEIRILFAFDPNRRAVMLLAGDKSSGGTRERWNRWYARAIPRADRLFRRYLKELEEAE